MVIVAGFIDLDPNERDSYLEARQRAIERTRAETGCREYVFSADSSDPGRVRVFEVWEREEDLDAHLALRSAAAPSPKFVSESSRELLRYHVTGVGPLRSA
jgi:quinol monooxygenase YgiN